MDILWWNLIIFIFWDRLSFFHWYLIFDICVNINFIFKFGFCHLICEFGFRILLKAFFPLLYLPNFRLIFHHFLFSIYPIFHHGASFRFRIIVIVIYIVKFLINLKIFIDINLKLFKSLKCFIKIKRLRLFYIWYFWHFWLFRFFYICIRFFRFKIFIFNNTRYFFIWRIGSWLIRI